MTVQEYCETNSVTGGLLSIWDLYSLYIPDKVSQLEVISPMTDTKQRIIASSGCVYYVINFKEGLCNIIKLEVLRGA